MVASEVPDLLSGDPADFQDPAYREAVIDLLGAISYGEISAFERLAEDSKMAPAIRDKMALATMAAAELGHVARLHERLTELGADPYDAMAPFIAPIEKFHRHTAPADWYEGLVKAYVGDGLAADFYREIADQPSIGGRLALWGRRLMGEALTQAQRVAAERDALSALLAGGIDRPGLDLAAIGRMFTRITDRHAARMAELGLSS